MNTLRERLGRPRLPNIAVPPRQGEPVATPIPFRPPSPFRPNHPKIGGANAPIIESYNVIEAYLPSNQPKNTLANRPGESVAN